MGRVVESICAYTPTLEVKRATLIRKVRRLPIPGEVMVKLGDKVSFDTVVARTSVPGNPVLVRVSNILGIDPNEIRRYMKKKIGDHVVEGECICESSGFLGFSKKKVAAPCSGTIETVSDITGQVIIRGEPVSVEVKAYIAGKVTEVLPRQGVIVETKGALIQGIFGFGGETHGIIKVLAESPEDVLTGDLINEDHKDKILVGGSLVTCEALEKAVKVGAKGVVTGSINDKDMTNFLGYDIGVAITGQEEVDITLIITEGFGKMSMSNRTFKLLKSFEGYHASMSGATQIRAGVIRPEIIIPHNITFDAENIDHNETGSNIAGGIKIGTLVRIIGDHYYGNVGKVSRLPVELQEIETESHVRVLEVTLEDGRRVTVPRANVEIIEE